MFPKEVTWNASLSQFDPCTNQCELEVQRIIHLQNITNQLPNAFTYLKRATKLHIRTVNALIHIDVPIGQSIETTTGLKRGRPIDSKYKNI